MTTKQAIVKQVQGTTLLARADINHWVAMDGSPTFGGSNAGSSPKELLLMAPDCWHLSGRFIII
jgi:uncharacterized OsmC-like protein